MSIFAAMENEGQRATSQDLPAVGVNLNEAQYVPPQVVCLGSLQTTLLAGSGSGSFEGLPPCQNGGTMNCNP